MLQTQELINNTPLTHCFIRRILIVHLVRHVEKQLHGAHGVYDNDHPRPRLKPFKTDINAHF